MTVKDLKERLSKLDDDKIVVITDGEGWCNIEKLEEDVSTVKIFEETEPVFSN